MKPEYGVRKWLWRLGLVLKSDFEEEYSMRRDAQEKSYKLFYENIRLKSEPGVARENTN